MIAASDSGAAWRSLVGPAIATVIGCMILVALGSWQLERKAWKDGLLAAIETRAHADPKPLATEETWATWRQSTGEYERVTVTGTLLADLEVPVHGIAEAGRGQGVLGFYLFTPMRIADGSIVFVNRGFVPIEVRAASTRISRPPAGESTIVGLLRAPETRGWFVPANDAAQGEWFVRDLGDMSRARGLHRVAPFYVDADATPNPGGWPRGGQTRLVLPNDHLQYAMTWFGLAGALLAVFVAFARRRISIRPDDERPAFSSMHDA